MKVEIVIPARLSSTRLPEKLLLRAAGKSILQHTYEAVRRSKRANRITLAVDDTRLADEAVSFGGDWVMTDRHHASGTDRIAQVAKELPGADIIVNVQGDEPGIDPAAIDLVAELLLRYPDAVMATVATPIRDFTRLRDPSCVKIVMGANDTALYFSRAAVPCIRDGVTDEHLAAEPPFFWHHLGLYAYRRDFLMWFAAQPPGRLEQLEKLEQLRAVEAGHRIVVGRVENAARGIDTQEDFDRFCEQMGSLE